MTRLARIAALGVVVLVGGIAMWGATGGGPAADVLGGRCTLGVVGAQATVTLQGIGAGAECNEASATGNFYREDLARPGGIVCRTERDGLVYTVRDVGLTIVGSELCGRFGSP